MSYDHLKWLEELMADQLTPGLVSVDINGEKWLGRGSLTSIFVAVKNSLPGTHPKQEAASELIRTFMSRRETPLSGTVSFESLCAFTCKAERHGECTVCKDTLLVECCNKGRTRCRCPDCGEDHEKDCERCEGTGLRPCGRCTWKGIYHFDAYTLGLLGIALIHRLWLAFPFAYLGADQVRLYTHRLDIEDREDKPHSIWICDEADQWRVWISGQRDEYGGRKTYAVFGGEVRPPRRVENESH